MTDIVDRLRYRMGGAPGDPAIIGYSDPGVTLEQDVTEAIAEIEQLRALADNANDILAEVWDQVPLGFACMPKVQAWLARYREARQR